MNSTHYVNRYKVDHRSKRDYGAQRASRPIMIGGVPYQGNSKQLHRASPRAGAKHVLSKGKYILDTQLFNIARTIG